MLYTMNLVVLLVGIEAFSEAATLNTIISAMDSSTYA
jgi:hypothetical protein